MASAILQHVSVVSETLPEPVLSTWGATRATFRNALFEEGEDVRTVSPRVKSRSNWFRRIFRFSNARNYSTAVAEAIERSSSRQLSDVEDGHRDPHEVPESVESAQLHIPHVVITGWEQLEADVQSLGTRLGSSIENVSSGIVSEITDAGGPNSSRSDPVAPLSGKLEGRQQSGRLLLGGRGSGISEGLESAISVATSSTSRKARSSSSTRGAAAQGTSSRVIAAIRNGRLEAERMALRSSSAVDLPERSSTA